MLIQHFTVLVGWTIAWFLGPDQMATEALLATDWEVSLWVQKYQQSQETVSQTDYEVVLSIFSSHLIGTFVTG